MKFLYAAISFNLSIIFLLYGILTISLLKRNFIDFYLKNNKKLIFATIGLSVPLMLRVIYETFNYCVWTYGSLELKNWNESMTNFNNVLFYCMCYLIPGAL